MNRYFIEVAYNGKRYAGFQKQMNANTIQAEIEKVLSAYFKSEFNLTGSSRTDAGVHALQNFFHFDTEIAIVEQGAVKTIYHLNAMLPWDLVIKSIELKKSDAHCRFDALSRTYAYRIYASKNPFLADTAYYFPYTLKLEDLNAAATIIKSHSDFEAFSKRSTQVHNFNCDVMTSEWNEEDGVLTYRVSANRFLRGMVKGLVGTMLQVGRAKIDIGGFNEIIIAKNAARVNFAVPAHGLTLMEVKYDSGFIK